METIALARALHVAGVVLWIGGLAFVTTALIPALRRLADADERLARFEAVERVFAPQARITTLVTGASGFYLAHELGLWLRFLQAEYWWMHAMVGLWVLFTLMLFVIEPIIRRRAPARMRHDPQSRFARLARLHALLLIASLATVIGAVAGSHGYLLFGG